MVGNVDHRLIPDRVVYPAFSVDWAKAVILGLEVGFVVWSTWAVFQIVVEVAVHGLNRYETARKEEEATMPDLTDIYKDEPNQA